MTETSDQPEGAHAEAGAAGEAMQIDRRDADEHEQPTSAASQIAWGREYIKDRYGSHAADQQETTKEEK